MTLSAKCFPYVAVCLLGALGLYGLTGIVLHIEELSNDDTEGSWPYNPKPGHVTIIILQGFFLVAFIFGVLAFWKDERALYYASGLILLGAFATLLVFGAVCLRTSQKDMTDDIYKSLKKFQGKVESEFDWFYHLQYNHKCCGVRSYKDWVFFKSGLVNDSVPFSCCLRDDDLPNPNKSCGTGILADGKTQDDVKNIIHIQPCGPILSPIFRHTAMILGLEMLIAAFIALCIAMYIYCGATQLFCMKIPPIPSRSDFISDPGSSVLTSNVRFSNFSEEDEEVKSNLVASNSQNSAKSHARIDSRGRIIRMSNQGRSKDKDKKNLKSKSSNNNPPDGPDHSKSKSGSSTQEGTSIFKSSSNKKNNKKKSFVKGNNKDQILKVSNSQNPIDKHKAQLNKKKGVSRVDSKALLHANRRIDSKTKISSKDDLFRKKLEMLYEGVDKNISTLSTTPNPSGSIFFPWSSKQSSAGGQLHPSAIHTSNKAHSSSKDQNKDSNSNNNPNPNPQNRKPQFPTLSHYSSVPQFQFVKFLGDFHHPLCLNNPQQNQVQNQTPIFFTTTNQHQSSQNNRHSHRHIYSYAKALQSIGLDSSGGCTNTNTNTTLNPTAITTPSLTVPPQTIISPVPVSIPIVIPPPAAVILPENPIDTSGSIKITSDLTNVTCPTPSVDNFRTYSSEDTSTGNFSSESSLQTGIASSSSEEGVVFPYPSPACTLVSQSASARSHATLPTIEEESESIKSSPKGLTPIPRSPSGMGDLDLSPRMSNMFGGSFINDLSLSAIKPVIVDENFEKDEVIVPLASVCTEEFTPTITDDFNTSVMSKNKSNQNDLIHEEDGDSDKAIKTKSNGNLHKVNRSESEINLSVQVVVDAFRELEEDFRLVDEDENDILIREQVTIKSNCTLEQCTNKKHDDAESNLELEVDSVSVLAKAHASKAQVRLGID